MLKSGPTGTRGDGWTTVPFILLVIVIVLHLVPIWIFPYFPSVDGPNHLSIAQILLRYDDPSFSFYTEYFQINDELVPNLLVHYLLSWLMRVLPPLLAEKAMLTLYVIALPLGVWYAMRAIGERPETTTLLITPFIFSFPLFMGFYNYSWGIVLFFWSMGYWFRVQDRLSAVPVFVLAALLLVTFLTHAFAAVNFVFLVAVTGGWRLIMEATKNSRRNDRSTAVASEDDTGIARILHFGILLALALVPALLFLEPVVSLLSNSLSSDFAPIYRSMQLGNLSAIVSLSPWEYLFSIPVVLILGVLFLIAAHRRWKQGGLEPADGVLLALFGYLALFFLIADKWYLLDRLMLYLFFALIVWLGTQTISQRFLRGAALGVAALSVGLLVARLPKFAELNGYVEEYVSAAEMVKRGSTLLGLRLAKVRNDNGKDPGFRIEATQHASAYISVLRNAVELANYQAKTGWFPVVYTPERNPYEHIARSTSIGTTPPDVEFLEYSVRTGGTVDYVLIWGPLHNVTDEPHVVSIMDQLRAGYDLIAVSERRGLMRLYRRRDCHSGSRTHRGDSPLEGSREVCERSASRRLGSGDHADRGRRFTVSSSARQQALPPVPVGHVGQGPAVEIGGRGNPGP